MSFVQGSMQSAAQVLRVIVAFMVAQVVFALLAVRLLFVSNALGSYSIYVTPVFFIALLFLCIYSAIRVYHMMASSKSAVKVGCNVR